MLETLGIDFKELIFAVINFLILIGVLGKFLYKPFLGILEKRTQTIKEAFDNAEATNLKADQKYEAYSRILARADDEAREIVKAAKVRADEQANRIVEDAKAEAVKIKEQALSYIEREKMMALADVREQIAELSMLAAEQILEKEISLEGQDQIIDSVLEKAGAGTWQN